MKTRDNCFLAGTNSFLRKTNKRISPIRQYILPPKSFQKRFIHHSPGDPFPLRNCVNYCCTPWKDSSTHTCLHCNSAIVGSQEEDAAASPATFGPVRPRTLQSSRLSPNGENEAIASAVKYLSRNDATSSLKAHLDALERHLDADGLEILALMRRNHCLNCE